MITIQRNLVVMLAVLALSAMTTTITGCATQTVQQPTNYRLDQAFAYTPAEIESEQHIYALSKPMKQYVEKRLLTLPMIDQRVEALSTDLFNPKYFQIDYDSQSDLTAAETFTSGSANCLSLTIMAFSLAQAAAIESQFRRVEMQENWSIRDDNIVINGHINLRLFQQRDLAKPQKQKYKVIDFQHRVNQLNSRQISRANTTALFYANRGADALLARDYDLAYSYFISAIDYQADEATVWHNLGVLYKRTGHLGQAEQVYRHALKLAPKDNNILESLAILYRQTDRPSMAYSLERKIQQYRQQNPSYHHMLGDSAFFQAQYLDALSHYRKSYRLDNKQPQLLLSMASTYYQLQRLEQAQKLLQRALRYVNSQNQTRRVKQQIAWLQQRIQTPQT